MKTTFFLTDALYQGRIDPVPARVWWPNRETVNFQPVLRVRIGDGAVLLDKTREIYGYRGVTPHV